MNDFDANLIREFRSRPAFYDRNNPRFKDKVFTAREWQEISNKLGYDVSLLKDRMLQLRNRYNLEKRRIEQEREVNPGASIESPWPLFDHLHFLSEHIRARRSYKRMLISAPHATRMDLHSPGSNSSSGEIGGGGGNGPPDDVDDNGMPQMNMHAAADFPNGFMPVRVKMEHDDDIETNSNGFDQNSSTLNGNIPSIHLQAYHQQDQPHNNEQQDTDPDESESLSITDNGAFVTAQSTAMISDKKYAYGQHRHHQPQQQQQQQQPQQQQQQQQRHHHHHQVQQPPQQPQRRNSSAPPPLKIRRIDSLRASGGGNTWIPVQPQNHKRHTRSSNRHSNSIGGVIPTHHPASSSNNNNHNSNNNAHLNSLRTTKYKSSAPRRSPTPTSYTTPREQKYVAFGDFVASSLLDLPPVTAMQLIERFTTEVVKTLIENDVTTESEQHKMATEGGASGGGGGGGGNTTGLSSSAACNGVAAAVN